MSGFKKTRDNPLGHKWLTGEYSHLMDSDHTWFGQVTTKERKIKLAQDIV